MVTPYPLLCRLHCTNICKATLFSQQRKGELQQGRKKAEQILIDDHEIRQLILTRPSSTSKPKHHTMAVILFCLVRCPNPILCMYACMHGTRPAYQCICDEPDPQPLRPDPVSTCLDLLAPSSDGHGRWWPAVLPWWPATIGYAAAAKAAGWAGPLHAFQCLQPWIRDLAGRMWQLYARGSQGSGRGRNTSAWRSSARASATVESHRGGVARPGRSLERCMESARAPGVCVTLLCSSVGELEWPQD